MNLTNTISNYFKTYTEAAPLAVFRIFFGIMMCISMIRFWSNGWIDSLYIAPKFHFKYHFFEWVNPIGAFTYVLFFVCGISALFVAIGYKYRIAIITFFLSFTYIELMDKTTYLNHYYFVSVVSVLMIFLPANAYFSVDSKVNSEEKQYGSKIPKWCLDSIKIFITIVYVYAGLAKLNSDWLFEALPLKIWLPSKFDTPLIGTLLTNEWTSYTFSWFGALYDLSIPFFLWYKRTRRIAFLFVVVFHILTAVLFPIGMFPYIMIVSAFIFFSTSFHAKIIYGINSIVKYPTRLLEENQKPVRKSEISKYIILTLLVIQLVVPWRYLFYPGELFWTEEGYRFSWRVMLMEKAGYAQFKIVDAVTGKWFYVDNSDFLTPFQEKQMSFQPDFILEYAHYLKKHFSAQGHKNIAIYADVYVALNGRLSAQFIDPETNLINEKESFKHKKWILPFNDEINGI